MEGHSIRAYFPIWICHNRDGPVFRLDALILFHKMAFASVPHVAAAHRSQRRVRHAITSSRCASAANPIPRWLAVVRAVSLQAQIYGSDHFLRRLPDGHSTERTIDTPAEGAQTIRRMHW